MPTYYDRRVNPSPLQAGDIFINTSTFKPAHCGIVVTHNQVIHATSAGGIVETAANQWESQADIFRANPPLTEDEKKKVCHIANEIKYSAEYGKCRAVFKSTFGWGGFGSGALARLEKYRERLQENQGMVKNVYCSELVILCYQLAWLQGAAPAGQTINTGHRLFISFDGSRTWPSTLRRMLNSNVNWTNLGTIN